MNQADFDVPMEVMIERQLLHRYGPLIGNDDLCQALGYPSKDAFRQALARKHVPVPVFDIENRRGKFALVADVAKWLLVQRSRAVNAEMSGSLQSAAGQPTTEEAQ
ncbi:hypothetical protein [Pseudoduganella aquatica]|uniref:hypothetical protein n=1 Tax=Pseudoduganella aquatica TaxID=2660641 RepID=UPI001E314D29|nr:hypothetical protein [Pseudoduganella aquatica]